MKRLWISTALATFFPVIGWAADLQVTLPDIGSVMPEAYTYCAPDGKSKVRDGGNVSPAIQWSGAPTNAQSFAILMVDMDVPKTFELANQDGKTIYEQFPRQNFYHWVLINIPASVTGLVKGQDSNGVTVGGKTLGKTAYGVRGKNDYAKLYQGIFGGYDGPCPPWNDLRVHWYRFNVYALDVPTLNLKEGFTGEEALQAMKPHIIAKGEAASAFVTNPALYDTIAQYQ